MKVLLLALLTIVSTQVHATSQSLEDHLANQVRFEKGIEEKIEAALKKEVGVRKLYGFNVRWEKLKCTAAITSELSEQSGGVCTVPAGAMQVGSQVGIIKGANKTTVAIIYADVE